MTGEWNFLSATNISVASYTLLGPLFSNLLDDGKKVTQSCPPIVVLLFIYSAAIFRLLS